MSTFRFSKEKYLQIAKTEGAEAALTQLHKDTIGWEIESFEGEKGYQPAMWNDLHEVRAFSRELWDLATLSEDSEKKNGKTA